MYGRYPSDWIEVQTGIDVEDGFEDGVPAAAHTSNAGGFVRMVLDLAIAASLSKAVDPQPGGVGMIQMYGVEQLGLRPSSRPSPMPAAHNPGPFPAPS